MEVSINSGRYSQSDKYALISFEVFAHLEFAIMFVDSTGWHPCKCAMLLF